jgi:hypothetical protein
MGILTLEVSGSMPWLGDESAHATRRPGGCAGGSEEPKVLERWQRPSHVRGLCEGQATLSLREFLYQPS